LGKILAVLVMLVSVVWAALTAQSYVTRTNWKTRAETYKKAFDRATDRLEEERGARIRAVSDLETRVRSLTLENEAQDKKIREVSKGNSDTLARITELDKAIKSPDEQNRELQAIRDVADKRSKDFRKAVSDLESANDKYRFDLESANRDKRTAEQQAALQLDRADDAKKRLEAAQDEIRGLKQQVAAGASGREMPIIPGERLPDQLLDKTRATVTGYKDGLVVINLGLDTGIQPRSVLTLCRSGAGGKFLGYIEVTETVQEKQAVAVFKPVSGKAIKDLKPDELPKIGDAVEKPK